MESGAGSMPPAVRIAVGLDPPARGSARDHDSELRDSGSSVVVPGLQPASCATGQPQLQRNSPRIGLR